MDTRVQRAQSGDSEAFAELYCEYRPRVFAICSRMLRDSHHAEDMTQDIFLMLLVKIGKFRHESKFSTWLHRVVVNHVLMSMRSKQPIMADEAIIYTLPDRPVDVVTRIDFTRALRKLSRMDHAAFVQHFVEGYTHAESAKSLGAGVGAMKSRTTRSRVKLHKYMTAGVGK